MQLPPIKRLLTEDFKGEEKWIAKLLFPLNQLFQALSTGLQNGITFQENIASQIHTVTFNNNSAELPIIFRSTMDKAPIGIWVIDVKDVSASPQALSSGVFVTSREYDSANDQHKIISLSGLVSGQQYKVTFVLI